MFYTHPKYVQSAWNKFHANSVETLGKIDVNLPLYIFLPYSGSKMTKYMAPGAYIPYTLTSSELKNRFDVNPRETFCQINEKLVLKYCSDPKNMASRRGYLFYTLLKVVPITFRTMLTKLTLYAKIWKTNFWSNFGLIRGSKRPTNTDPTPPPRR